MPADLERWCRTQLSRLTGNEDLTLMHFCMTLEEAEDVTEYITQYLGRSAEVTKFASEFLRRKDAASWQPAGKGKKGGGAPKAPPTASLLSGVVVAEGGKRAQSAASKRKRKKRGKGKDSSLANLAMK